jgi:hypothetical protein
MPLFVDPLSEGEKLYPLPLFSYLLAFSTLVLPEELAYALVPNALAVLLHAALFFLALELTNNRGLATLAAIASIFIPTYLAATLFTLSSLSLALPLLFLTLTLFIKLRKSKERRWHLLGATLALLLTHPVALILLPTLVLALALATVRRANGLTIQYEYALFATALIIWAHLLYYRDSILANGFRAFQANTPSQLMGVTYGAPNIFELGLAVGLIPFGLALYAAYKEGVARHPGIQTTIALAASAVLLVALGAVQTTTGTILFATACIPLAAVGLQHLRSYARTLHRQALGHGAGIVLVALFLFTSGLSTVVAANAYEQTVSEDAIVAARWLRENSLPSAIVLAEPQLGSLIAHEANRRPYLGTNYHAQTDSTTRLARGETVLRGEGIPELTRETKIEYLFTTTPIRSDCVNTVRRGTYTIQKVLCR